MKSQALSFLFYSFLCFFMFSVSCKKENKTPACTISGPATGQGISIGNTVEVTVSASDEDGSIAKVEISIDQSLKTTLTASPYTYDWNTTGEPEGTYTITATAYDDADATVSDEIQVQLIDSSAYAPVADFSAGSVTVEIGQSIQFTDASTNAPASWEWDMGDGNTSSDQNPSHTYTATGVYDVSLIVVNNYGSDTLTRSAYITITEVSPVADFSASSTSVMEGDNITFTDLSTESPTSWSWDFGDGNTSTQQNPVHSYSSAGTYTVSLSVTNANGSDTETKSNYIDVSIVMNISCPGTPTVTDADGNSYQTVQIGSQCWMRSNLNVGTTITNQWGGSVGTNNGITEKYCFYNTSSNCNTYGGLYQWDEMMDYNPSDNGTIGTTRGVCPSGWHIPTDSEWQLLINNLGGSSVAGGKMKETGTSLWNSPNTGASNASGFSALPGGQSDANPCQICPGFGGNNDEAWYWSATKTGSNARNYKLFHDFNKISNTTNYSTDYGFSVRCIKN